VKTLLVLAAAFTIISVQAQAQVQPTEPATPFSGMPPMEDELAALPRCKQGTDPALRFDSLAIMMGDSDLELIYPEVMGPIDRKAHDKYKTSACFALGKFTVALARFQDTWKNVFRPLACPNELSKQLVGQLDEEIAGMITANRVLQGYCDPAMAGVSYGTQTFLRYNDDEPARKTFDAVVTRFMHFQNWARRVPDPENSKQIAADKVRFLKAH
jgi:hypothetical protein